MFELREGRMTIPPPKRGACPVCGELHGREEPHNKNSLLYQHRFRMKNGRYPTWEDAMEHCSMTVKKRFCERLKRNGVSVNAEKLISGAFRSLSGEKDDRKKG